MRNTSRRNVLKSIVYRLQDPQDVAIGWTLGALLLLFEAIVCTLIIARVPYTEIDWQAYMQEVQGYQEGERNYLKLRGHTGPLVYPAGFVYLFSGLRTLTGEAVLPAQAVFAVLYVATQAVVMALYIKSKSLPPWTLVLLCLSRRMHSIYVLRLFNDCWAMFVAYCATLVLQARKYALAVVLYSLAVSIKMNVLLMAPGVLAVILRDGLFRDALRGVIAGIVLQLSLAAPFLLTYPTSYTQKAFEFTRVFLYKWTVNWHFLPESWFVSQQLAVLLLLAHLMLLWSFANRRWFAEQGLWEAGQIFRSPRDVKSSSAKKGINQPGSSLPAEEVLRMVFTANFVGIVCARSLHYQFYSWYFHTIPFVLFRGQLPVAASLLTFFALEFVWNVYPPRAWTSLLLLALHLLVLHSAWAIPCELKQKTDRETLLARRHMGGSDDAGEKLH